MEVLYARCAGLDVHKKTVVACLLTPGPRGQATKTVRTFGTMTADLLAMAEWLRAAGCTHAAMESTGVYWKPIWNVLEGSFTLRHGQCAAYEGGAGTQDGCQGC